MQPGLQLALRITWPEVHPDLLSQHVQHLLGLLQQLRQQSLEQLRPGCTVPGRPVQQEGPSELGNQRPRVGAVSGRQIKQLLEDHLPPWPVLPALLCSLRERM